MPRYRLFGETAKFAALLNSTGEGKNLFDYFKSYLIYYFSSNEDPHQPRDEDSARLHRRLHPRAAGPDHGRCESLSSETLIIGIFPPGTWPEGDLLAYRWNIFIQSYTLFLHGRDYNQCIKEGKMARSLLMAVTTSARWKNGFPYIVKRAENTSRSRALTTCVGCQAISIWTTSL